MRGRTGTSYCPISFLPTEKFPSPPLAFLPLNCYMGELCEDHALDILRETWQSDRRSNESVLSHVLAMREKLSHMTELVRENLTRAQQQQKHWYDRTAVEREFQTGDQVLVLLPTDTSKLLARWQGPYQILRRIGKVDYLVNMHDKRKKKRVLHVNMLQKWHSPTLTATDYAAEEVRGDGEENDIPVWKEDTPDPQPTIGEQLSNKEQGELKVLLRRYARTLQSQPGLTPLVEHRICTGTAHPIRLPPLQNSPCIQGGSAEGATGDA